MVILRRVAIEWRCWRARRQMDRAWFDTNNCLALMCEERKRGRGQDGR